MRIFMLILGLILYQFSISAQNNAHINLQKHTNGELITLRRSRRIISSMISGIHKSQPHLGQGNRRLRIGTLTECHEPNG